MAGSSAANPEDSASAPALPPEDATLDAPPVNEPSTEQPGPEASVATASVEIERVVELWPAVIGHLQETGSAMLGSLFDEARPLGIDEERSTVRIGFPESAKFNKKKAESKGNLERMSEAISAVTGAKLRPVYEVIEVEEGAAATPEASAEMSEDDLVEMIKDNFDASEVVSDDTRESEAG